MAEEYQATILVVEDDPGALRLQQIRLERAGHRVLPAATADQALQAIRGNEIDLILLDQNLGGPVTGLELYQQIKEAGFDLPAILVTGFPGEAIVLQSFRAGVHDFIPKTADYIDYLMPTIERVLKKRRTECQLVESEARLSSVVQSALDAVLTVDEKDRVTLCNAAAEKMFGLECSRLIGESVRIVLPNWGARPPTQAPKPGVSVQHWETEGLRADGTGFPAEVSAAWVEANRRRFWTCVVRDVTERKRAQRERERLIREQAARMEAEAAHRQAEAARARMEIVARENDRLYQELRQVDRLKDEFLAMLAHELRNPLAPIRNALHLINLEVPGQSQALQENWSIIDRQVTHLVRLVDDLLDVSRISQGKIHLQRQALDLADVIARAVESSRPLIDARRHTLNVHLPEGPLVIEGDLVRLVQVLANLLNNAAKYTPEGGRIDLTVEREGGEAAIRVIDTGMGVPADILPRLFDPFTQSERTLERADGGLGIGLTLVRRLTEMHGGRVEAHSAGLGEGSTFVVRLPLLSIDDRRLPIEETATPESATPQSKSDNQQSRRVLVVDDNSDSARTLTRLLERLGHEVRSANDGPGTLTAVEEFGPEVVLLDIGLPGMDGYEVARRLRATPKFNRTLLVALTGYGSPEDRQRSEQAGFNAHLVKPVDLDALKELLARPQSLLGYEPEA